jgi:hypothetical protein
VTVPTKASYLLPRGRVPAQGSLPHCHRPERPKPPAARQRNRAERLHAEAQAEQVLVVGDRVREGGVVRGVR